jgi:hypothetical protein
LVSISPARPRPPASGENWERGDGTFVAALEQLKAYFVVAHDEWVDNVHTVGMCFGHLAERLSAEYFEIEGSGHDLPLDAAAPFALGLVLAWLGRSEQTSHPQLTTANRR